MKKIIYLVAPLMCFSTLISCGSKPNKKTYLVEFNTMGGTFIAPEKVVEGNKAIRPINPKIKGYSFINWYADEQETSVFDFNTPIVSNIVLYAKYSDGPVSKKFSFTGKHCKINDSEETSFSENLPLDSTKFYDIRTENDMYTLPETIDTKNKNIDYRYISEDFAELSVSIVDDCDDYSLNLEANAKDTLKIIINGLNDDFIGIDKSPEGQKYESNYKIEQGNITITTKPTSHCILPETITAQGFEQLPSSVHYDNTTGVIYIDSLEELVDELEGLPLTLDVFCKKDESYDNVSLYVTCDKSASVSTELDGEYQHIMYIEKHKETGLFSFYVKTANGELTTNDIVYRGGDYGDTYSLEMLSGGENIYKISFNLNHYDTQFEITPDAQMNVRITYDFYQEYDLIYNDTVISSKTDAGIDFDHKPTFFSRYITFKMSSYSENTVTPDKVEIVYSNPKLTTPPVYYVFDEKDEDSLCIVIKFNDSITIRAKE